MTLSEYLTGVASPKGPGGPGPHHFLTFLKVKAYVGPTIFWGIQGPIIIGHNQFQKRDYTPAYQEAQRVEVQKELNIEGPGPKDSNSTNTEI